MGMHSSAFKLLAKHKQHQIDEQLAMQGKYRTEGPGWYVTVQIEGPDGPEVYKVWAADDDEYAPHHGRRMNPPLSEHMAHNKLEDIEELLASRIIAETMTGRNGVFIFGDFIYELSSQIRIQLRDKARFEPDSLQSLHPEVAQKLDALLDASEKVRSLFKEGPIARLFPQHVGRNF